MNRNEKELVISDLKNRFASSQAAFVVQYKGLTVAQMQELRKTLRQQGGTMRVAKARLMKLAMADMPVHELGPVCKDQVALIFAEKETAPIAKAISEFAKENQALAIMSGFADQKLMDRKTITILATLPSREVLLAQLCGVLKGPIAALARVLQAAHEAKAKV